MAVNLTDWARTAAQRGWGLGWPSCAGVTTSGTAIVTADRSGTRLSVHKRIARLVDLLIDETERRGFLLKPRQCGAYNCRPIAGTSVPSNHSWALAVDLNWLDNTYNTTGIHTIPTWVYDLWADYGFANGSMYSGAKDWMHFEFMGWPSDADAMTALALTDLAGVPTGTPAPDVPEDTDMLDNRLLSLGRNDLRLIVPVGSKSSVTAKAWVSVVGNGGPVTGVIYAQGDDGGLRNFDVRTQFVAGHSSRWWAELPDGTTQIGVVLDAPAGGALAIEALPK